MGGAAALAARFRTRKAGYFEGAALTPEVTLQWPPWDLLLHTRPNALPASHPQKPSADDRTAI